MAQAENEDVGALGRTSSVAHDSNVTDPAAEQVQAKVQSVQLLAGQLQDLSTDITMLKSRAPIIRACAEGYSAGQEQE